MRHEEDLGSASLMPALRDMPAVTPPPACVCRKSTVPRCAILGCDLAVACARPPIDGLHR